MRVSGQWYRCLNGVVRPVIRGAVIAGDGAPVVSFFLVDTGADRTVLSRDVLGRLGLQQLPPTERIAGVGGAVATVDVETNIRLLADDGRSVAIRGRYAAATDRAALDMSVLGRDVTGFFALIVDRPGDAVCLLNQNHRYAITAS